MLVHRLHIGDDASDVRRLPHRWGQVCGYPHPMGTSTAVWTTRGPLVDPCRQIGEEVGMDVRHLWAAGGPPHSTASSTPAIHSESTPRGHTGSGTIPMVHTFHSAYDHDETYQEMMSPLARLGVEPSSGCRCTVLIRPIAHRSGQSRPEPYETTSSSRRLRRGRTTTSSRPCPRVMRPCRDTRRRFAHDPVAPNTGVHRHAPIWPVFPVPVRVDSCERVVRFSRRPMTP